MQDLYHQQYEYSISLVPIARPSISIHLHPSNRGSGIRTEPQEHLKMSHEGGGLGNLLGGTVAEELPKLLRRTGFDLQTG